MYIVNNWKLENVELCEQHCKVSAKLKFSLNVHLDQLFQQNKCIWNKNRDKNKRHFGWAYMSWLVIWQIIATATIESIELNSVHGKAPKIALLLKSMPLFIMCQRVHDYLMHGFVSRYISTGRMKKSCCASKDKFFKWDKRKCNC